MVATVRVDSVQQACWQLALPRLSRRDRRRGQGCVFWFAMAKGAGFACGFVRRFRLLSPLEALYGTTETSCQHVWLLFFYVSQKEQPRVSAS